MSTSGLLFRLANFTRIPLVRPRLLEIGIRNAVLTIPALVFLIHSFHYYVDFLQSQSLQFFNTSHYEIYDFIVVGGGSAGAVVANRLSLHNRVLLLELGGDPNPLSFIPISAGVLQRCPSTDLMYETVPQNKSCFGLRNNIMFWPRGTGIGGSSNLNYMIYQRGNPKDYDNWAKITNNSDWSYANVLKYFKRLESYHGAYPSDDYHGRNGPLHVEKARQTYMEEYFLNAAKEKGFKIHDTNAEQGEGFGEMDVTTFNGLRWSTYPAYIEPILKRKNLTISRYSRVVKIHLDKDRHAYGVTYYRHGVKKFVRAEREIIISAGAVDSPKLLLLSSIGPRKHLHSLGMKCRVNLPVGQNLQDHVFTMVGPFVFEKNVTGTLDGIKDATLDTLIQYTSNGMGPLASISTISAVGFYSTINNTDGKIENWPDIQYFETAFRIPPGVESVFENIFNARRNLMETYLSPIVGRHSNTILQVLVRPKSRGYIELAGRSPFLKPTIQPNYFADKADIAAMIDGMKLIVDLYENTTTYKELGAKLIPSVLHTCRHFDWKSLKYYECCIRTITQTLYHPVGTCAMGRNDYYTKTAQGNTDVPPVVDSELRVFKTRGLRVIDASIMPVIVNSNTNVPSIMIGEVGVDFIRKYWTEETSVCTCNSLVKILLRKCDEETQCTYKKIY